jgi:uncharacterized repeat protein (TIGR03803 family)
MKKSNLVRAIALAGFTLLVAGQVTAQTFTVLHGFTSPIGDSGSTNSDGMYPRAGLILSGDKLYGTTAHGGVHSFGTVFKVNTDATGFTNLHSFNYQSDGSQPFAGLILSGNTLYGTAIGGGSFGNGTVFKLNTDGTGFANLHSFTALSGPNSNTNSDGARPRTELVLSGNTLYGTATEGGSFGNGTVFALNTDGTGFTNLHTFTATYEPSHTNSDGTQPNAGLFLSGNTLYGTAFAGGRFAGTVFALKTDGTGFTTLHHFTGGSGGANPAAGLVLSGSTLYGTTQFGGNFDRGTVFALNTNGTGFTTLRRFTGDDAFLVHAALMVSGNTLYGTAQSGGRRGDGTVFALNTDGSGYTNLHSFNYDGDGGSDPFGGLVLSGSTLYGTAIARGTFGQGTVFSLSFAPRLTINRSVANVILTWPKNIGGFDSASFILQSTTNLVSAAFWSTNFPAPTLVNGHNTVTDPVSGPKKFYRLSQ